jgi:uncharacterized protein (DUF2235 family)
MSKTDEQATISRTAQGGEQGDQIKDSSSQPPRKFMLFADGTGNAFTTQESNVWRLYEALDRTKPDQVACYIKGVGTVGWRPLAILDGATGIGVPSNVRKLYRFLCWNWKPADKIYIIGFSRGAFTARTLVALIRSQGLVPAEFNDVPVSHGDMQRNAMAAWRAYRRETVPWHKSLPTIWLTRLIRDVVLAVHHFVLRLVWGCPFYSEVRKAMEGRRDVDIEFLGLFDTVEAYGVPIEELRTAIDWAIWPISFRNRRVSDKVQRVRHALSLDDERTTFHPIRFDQSDQKDRARIKEVWFSGVHSDVGGGYPDGTLSYVPLVWMAGQLKDDLRFQPGSIDHFRAYQSAIGPMHDSRSGAAILYRYGPRPIGEEKVDGGPPIVHLAVVNRMLHGCDDYAPVTLPASAKVLIPDSDGNAKELELTKEETRTAMRSAYATAAKAGDYRSPAAEAFIEMSPPDKEVVQLVLDTVWWRRFAYFSLLIAIAMFGSWPWAAKAVVAMLAGPTDKVVVDGASALKIITSLDYRVGAVAKSSVDFIQNFLPSYVAPWLNVAVFYPVATTAIAALVGFAWYMNGFLRDRIWERARLAWNRPHRMVPEIGKGSWLLRVGRVMRLHTSPLRIAFTDVVVPAIFLIVIFGAVVLAAGRSYFHWSAGGLCHSTSSVMAVGDQPSTVPALFETNKLCWASGLGLEKGRKYRIWMAVKDPWFDRTIMTGVNGFKLARFLPFLPVRRWYRADWFQPIARIGAQGDAELPLADINARPADELPRPRNTIEPKTSQTKDVYPVSLEDTAEFNDPASDLRHIWIDFGTLDPIPQPTLAPAGDIWRRQGLAKLMVADFMAAESGELFLYVNDAIQFFPLFGPYDLFYRNNSGSAQVTLQRLQLPPPGR